MPLSPTLQRVARFAKRKTVLGAMAAIAVTGTAAEIHFNKPTQPVRYVLAAVTRGTVVASITGTGQVSDENQLDVKPPGAAKVMSVRVKPGDVVKTGDILAQLDASDAQKTMRDAAQSVNDARLSLSSAELSLKKLQQSADAQALLKAEHTLAQAQRDLDDLTAGTDPQNIRQAEADVAVKQDAVTLSSDGKTPQLVRDVYDDAASDIRTASRTLEDAVTDADEVLGIDATALNDAYENLLGVKDATLLPAAQSSYYGARDAAKALKKVADGLRVSGEEPDVIEAALPQAQQAAAKIDALLQKTADLLAGTISSASFSQSSLDGLRSGIRSARSSVASTISSLTNTAQSLSKSQTDLLSAQAALAKAESTLASLKRDAPNNITAAQERVSEAQAALDDLKKGADALDIASAQNSIAQRRSSLASAANRWNDAKKDVEAYTIRAPFDGTVADVAVRANDEASAGTALLTLLTDQDVAHVTINEVDAARIKAGQKATLTFDAFPDLTIAGTVSSVDGVGTVSQGVVTYGLTITFAASDERVKPGMSVSANIVTDAKTDVLIVPASAVSSINGESSVRMLANATGTDALSPTGVTSQTPPTFHSVTAGLSNEQSTEIVEGLNEGDLVVVRTIQPTTAQTATRQNTNSLIPGGGNAIRIQGGGGGFTGGNATFVRPAGR